MLNVLYNFGVAVLWVAAAYMKLLVVSLVSMKLSVEELLFHIVNMCFVAM